MVDLFFINGNWCSAITYSNQACESSAETQNSAEMDLPGNILVNPPDLLRKLGGGGLGSMSAKTVTPKYVERHILMTMFIA